MAGSLRLWANCEFYMNPSCRTCACVIVFFSVLLWFTIGFGLFFSWLWFRTFLPSISIEKFQVPALNKTLYGTSNDIIDPTITFDLRLKNENLNEGVHYDAVNVTLYYYHANISTYTPIGNVSLPGFYQGHYKKAHRVASISSYGVPWDIARFEVLNGSTTTFRVYVDTRIKFKYMLFFFWSVNGKHYRIGAGDDILVNDQGIKSVKRGLKLLAD